MPDTLKVLAHSTVTGGTAVGSSSGTTLIVVTGEGARFPDDTPFWIGISPIGSEATWGSGSTTGGNVEYCRATRAVGGNTLNLVRAQLGSTARTVVVGDQVFQPDLPTNYTSGVLVESPTAGGIFQDFHTGVNGIRVLETDPPSPSWFDAIEVTHPTTSTFMYATDPAEAGFSPLPMMLKITSSAAGVAEGRWGTYTFPSLTKDYGRFYFYFDVDPSVTIRPLLWENSDTSAYLNFNFSTRKFEIRNNTANVLWAASNNALTAAKHYRVEYEYVSRTDADALSTTADGGESADSDTIAVNSTAGWNTTAPSGGVGGSFNLFSGGVNTNVTYTAISGNTFTGCSAHPATALGDVITAGTITLNIYEGHGLVLFDTFKATARNGKAPISRHWGNVNGASLASKVYRLGALAGGCTTWPGPWTGQERHLGVQNQDGVGFATLEADGSVVVRSTKDYRISSGGTAHYMIRRGDEVARLSSAGLSLGPTFGVGNPLTVDDSDGTYMNIDIISGRSRFHSMNVVADNDPSDITYSRIMSASDQVDIRLPIQQQGAGFGYVGFDARTTAGSDTVTFGDLFADPNAVDLRTTVDGVNAVDSTTITVASTSGWSPVRGKFLLYSAAEPEPRLVTYRQTSAGAGDGITTVGGKPAFNNTSYHPATVGGEAITPAYDFTLKDRGHGIHIGPTGTVSGVHAGGDPPKTLTVVSSKETGTGEDWPTSGILVVVTTGPTLTSLTYGPRTNADQSANRFPITAGTLPALSGGELVYLQDGGNGFVANGQQYNISEILTPTSVRVIPTPQETASGLVWKLKSYPFTDLLTGGKNALAIGQIRSAAMAFPKIREGAAGATHGMSTIAGSNTVTVPAADAFDSRDIDRFLLIHDDPTMPNNRGAFIITGVDAAGTSITLDDVVRDTLNNVKWVVAGKEQDGGGGQMEGNSTTMVIKQTHHCLIAGSGKVVTGEQILFNFINPNVVYGTAGVEARNILTLDSNGQVTVGYGPFGYGGKGSGSAVTQAGAKTASVVTHTASGKITMSGSGAILAKESAVFKVYNQMIEDDYVPDVDVRASSYTAGPPIVYGRNPSYVANVCLVDVGVSTTAVNTDGATINTLNSSILTVGGVTTAFPSSGEFHLLTSGGTVSTLVTYTNKTANTFTGCSNHPACNGGELISTASFSVAVTNITGGSLTENPVLNFNVFAGSDTAT